MNEWQERIAEAIALSGLTRAEVSRAIPVSKGTITQWCGGSSRPIKRPTWNRLKKLATVTGVSFDWLLTGKGTPKGRSSSMFKEEELHLLYKLIALPDALRLAVEAQIEALYAATGNDEQAEHHLHADEHTQGEP
jgi:transcriptional regulator with XRE-family HTH domain